MGNLESLSYPRRNLEEENQFDKNKQDSNVKQNNDCSKLQSRSALNSTTEVPVSSHSIKTGVTANDFEVKKVLGQGCYGNVLLVRKIHGEDNSHCFAMKVIEKQKVLKNGLLIQRTQSERVILETVKHPFIIDLKYAFQTKKRLYLVMEFCAGGELFNRMKGVRRFIESTVRFYLAECVLGLEYLHSKGIVYRDLKPENIMLDSEGHIKLIDFGVSRDGMFEGISTKTYCGTLEYMAPEVLLANRTRSYGKAVDWWSLGILMYEMFFGRTPFHAKGRKEVIQKILYGSFIINHNICISIGAENLIRELLVKRASERLGGSSYGADPIKCHRFFETCDWVHVVEKRIKPPFKPEITHPADTQYFSSKYTCQSIKDTPLQIDSRDVYDEKEDEMFKDFSYMDPDYNRS